jgi:hypothetical protein
MLARGCVDGDAGTDADAGAGTDAGAGMDAGALMATPRWRRARA